VRNVNKTLAGFAALTLILAACGDDDDDDAGAAATTAAAAATDAPATTAGAAATTAAPATEAPGTTAGSESTEAPGTTAAAGSSDLDALYQECLDNGATVNLIALPDEWANYKGILQSFRDKYPGVENPVQNPNGSSQEELDAIVNLEGQPDMPDAIDVSPAKATIATQEGLWTPFTPSTDAEIPDNLKDPDGNWVAAYYGVMALQTNTTIVPTAPKTWADLAKPDYKGLVALNGDPRTSGSAIAAVMAASLANGGSPDDIMPGIQYFADLKASGNLIPTEVTQATVISGETPIAIDWSYNYPGLAAAIEDAGYTVEINFPTDGVYGGYYAQGVVAGSPHQACGKLWIEHILSDEGALGYLEGGAMPARYAAVDAAGLISAEDKANLPPADVLAQVQFLTEEQTAAADAAIQENWGPMVADA
jgi:putative spermidine/putrescine transport system substrate-binding protein